MEAVNKVFDTVRQLLKSTIPPCVATVDNEEHYEVCIMNSTHPEKILLGYVIKHDDSITVGFNDKLDESRMKQLFSKSLLQKMNIHKRIRIYELGHPLLADLQEAINHLMHYYTDNN